ncbi:uncharacterized protein LOC113559666 [Rhopalosiphum maidis]|uniref:uncharacterized protein LOC113559666 n=1 Tax=Rhopalosiphum maidis TaxID=43146 RepID=UPI000F0012A8|nr:uncharacterized protein LOC113559666 [Rhopalosiphum maidis]
MEIYGSFVFDKNELECNGILTHQMIKFTRSIDPTLITYVKIEKVTMRKLVRTIKRRLRDNFRIYRLIKFDMGASVVLYAVPTVKFDGTDQSQLRLVSSQEGLKMVLLEALADLECAYTQISSDFVMADEDPLNNWSLTATTYADIQELIMVPGLRRINYCFATPNTAAVYIKNVRLSKLLYVIMHTNTVGPNLVRDNTGPFILNNKRQFETFRMPRTNKTSRKILRDVQLTITGPKITLSELWNLAMDYLDGFL